MTSCDSDRLSDGFLGLHIAMAKQQTHSCTNEKVSVAACGFFIFFFYHLLSEINRKFITFIENKKI